MTSRELRNHKISEISDEIWESVCSTAYQGQINHYEVIKNLVTLIVEKDERLDALEAKLDETQHDVRRLERNTKEDRY